VYTIIVRNYPNKLGFVKENSPTLTVAGPRACTLYS